MKKIILGMLLIIVTSSAGKIGDYKFVLAGELIAFPDDFIGKKIYMACLPLRIKKDGELWELSLNCQDKKSSNTARNLIEQDIKNIILNKDDAKKAFNSAKTNPLAFLGTFNKNKEKYSMFKYIFKIDSALTSEEVHEAKKNK